MLRRSAWWLHPAWTGVLVVLPCLAITWLTPDEGFRRWWHTPKYFESADGVITALLLGSFVVGTILPSLTRGGVTTRSPQMTATATQQKILRQAGRVFLALTLAGYAAWAIVALSHGYGVQELYGVLRLEQGALLSARRQYFSTVPGVTTLTQFGPLSLVCLLLNRRISGQRHTLALAVLVSLTLARAFVNAERLALIEMVIPTIVLAAALLPKGIGQTRRTWLWAMLPLLAPVALTIVFGAFEYTRSWNDFYAQNSDTGFGEFIMHRLGGYYATAGNNSAILLTYVAPSAPLPHFTVPFVWDFPILKSLFEVHSVLGSGSGDWAALLARYGNPEFVNAGGLLIAVADYGLIGALMWWGVIGLLLGSCYRSLRAGELHGLVLYAVVYVGMLEIGRIFYWGLGRAFPVIVGGLIISVLLHRARNREDCYPQKPMENE